MEKKKRRCGGDDGAVHGAEEALGLQWGKKGSPTPYTDALFYNLSLSLSYTRVRARARTHTRIHIGVAPSCLDSSVTSVHHLSQLHQQFNK